MCTSSLAINRRRNSVVPQRPEPTMKKGSMGSSRCNGMARAGRKRRFNTRPRSTRLRTRPESPPANCFSDAVFHVFRGFFEHTSS
jgi:hypothetical protein